MCRHDIDWFAAFPLHAQPPALTLRGANAIDDYGEPLPFDPAVDQPTADYFEQYPWGVSHLDTQAWLHYLPHFLDYAHSRRQRADSRFVNAFLEALGSMHFNVRVAPRLDALQRACIVRLLDQLAFDDDSAWKDASIRALKDFWAPGASQR